jgi:hypothetical protein
MKRTLVLLTCLLALALSASAQNQINFANLPLVKVPAPMPSNYAGFNWTNIFYVDPAEWSGAGPGYKLGSILNRDVAFVGGASCTCCPPRLVTSCNGTISLNTSGGELNNQLSFQAVNATVAAGFGPTSITVLAYNNGKYVGTAFYRLDGNLQTINFPSSWGNITELNFQTAAGEDLVFYDLQVYLLLG